MGSIKIHSPGLLTTVQDIGRFGYQQFGMPVSGAMDFYSLKLANYLVGNSHSGACLEVTATGPEIEFEGGTFIAICGANMQPQINGKEVEMYSTLPVKDGDRLHFKGLKSGFRTYIAFAGGIDVPLVMGSKSTYLQGKIGGFHGRALETGNILKVGNLTSSPKTRKATNEQIPNYTDNLTVRVIPGPEADRFSINGLAGFLNSEFKLSSECNRMGYRLTGEKVEHKSSPDIISSGIAFGTIQVPAHGEPIIMMADRQTTGGYARIANVISVDLPYLAQLQPDDKVRFKEIELNEAIDLLKKSNKLLGL